MGIDEPFVPEMSGEKMGGSGSRSRSRGGRFSELTVIESARGFFFANFVDTVANLRKALARKIGFSFSLGCHFLLLGGDLVHWGEKSGIFLAFNPVH